MARQRGLRLSEMPISWSEREKGESKISLLEIFRMGRSALKFWYRVNFCPSASA
jgi:hypothetical protein